MGPDPTRAYFWPAVNKRLPRLWPGYFPTWPEEIFFWPEGNKIEKLTFLGEIFQIQTQTINGWPDPGQKFLTQIHHYYKVKMSFSCISTVWLLVFVVRVIRIWEFNHQIAWSFLIWLYFEILLSVILLHNFGFSEKLYS